MKPHMHWLDEPTEEDIAKLARVASKAFDGDTGNYFLYGGFQRSENVEISEAIYRAWLRRGIQGGARILTDDERHSLRLVMAPGKRTRIFDRSLEPTDDPDWLVLRQYCDPEACYDRAEALAKVAGPMAIERYGPDMLQTTWRTALTAVDPDVQGQGYGRASVAFIISEVEKSGSPWWHCCLDHNRTFFERCGMQFIQNVRTGVQVPEKWKGLKEDGVPVAWFVVYENQGNEVH